MTGRLCLTEDQHGLEAVRTSRIRGAHGCSEGIERVHREAASGLIGEGTSDVRGMIIGRRLLEDHALR